MFQNYQVMRKKYLDRVCVKTNTEIGQVGTSRSKSGEGRSRNCVVSGNGTDFIFISKCQLLECGTQIEDAVH